jgi:hypothetical protein
VAPPQPPPPPPPPPEVPLTVTVESGIKQLNFSWTELAGSTHYRLLENPDGHSGFTQVGADIPADTLSASRAISVHLFDFVNALYIVEGCDASSCTSSSEVSVMSNMISTIGYFKASNNRSDSTVDNTGFGRRVALNADGTTMAVSMDRESSSATGVDGDQSDTSAAYAGAVYLFRYDGTAWFQQAYIKASNTDAEDYFGTSIALSADGSTLAVGAYGESSIATGVNGDQSDNSATNAGAVYLFRFDGTDWFQQAYIKASNSETGDRFGTDVSLSADGDALAVGALYESSNASGVNGDQNNNSDIASGAAYVFQFDGANWAQFAYVKASNGDPDDNFGDSVVLSEDGARLVVAAGGEDSSATGIDGDQTDNSAENSGAVYVFDHDGTDWLQTAYVKASNTDAFDAFGGTRGNQLSLSGDGNTFAVGAYNEQSNAAGVNGDQNNNSADRTGAAYVFRFDGTEWFQWAYIKASNSLDVYRFGYKVELSSDGATLAVGVQGANGCDAGVGGDPNNNGCGSSGAVYVFRHDGMDWAQSAYVKSSNPEGGDALGDGFGSTGVAMGADGTTLAVASDGEDSNASGIGGDQSDNSAFASGAVYLY